MMPPFPSFKFPMFYNPYRNPYYNALQHNMDNNTGSSVPNNNYYKNYDTKASQKNGQIQNPPLQSGFGNNTDTDSVSSDSTRSSNEQFFDIFGIRLYFDDILILCLLFFLYQEEVNDQLLFMALLLLLLS